MPVTATTETMVENVYKKTRANLEVIRQRLNRPLTLAEKVLFGHLADARNQPLRPGSGFLQLNPDRVAMQDATAQMAILQFAQAGIPQVKVPSTVHCDHLILAQNGSSSDLKRCPDHKQGSLRFSGFSLGKVWHRILETGIRHYSSDCF